MWRDIELPPGVVMWSPSHQVRMSSAQVEQTAVFAVALQDHAYLDRLALGDRGEIYSCLALPFPAP